MRPGRDRRIIALRADGLTLQAIGRQVGLTRERVRQILAEHCAGRLGEDRRGADAARERKERADQRRAEYERRVREHYGCDVAMLRAINPGSLGDPASPARKYLEQKSKALRRGIEFSMTLPEWWKVWQDSGKWEARGRFGYCMGRHGDAGPYAIGNVYITTIEQNLADGRANKRARTEGLQKSENCGRMLSSR